MLIEVAKECLYVEVSTQKDRSQMVDDILLWVFIGKMLEYLLA